MTTTGLLFMFLLISGYLLTPLALFIGWRRWINQPKTRIPILSLIGFIFATSSAVCGVLFILYAQVHPIVGGYRDRGAKPFFASGFLLSLLGFLLGACGTCSKNPLRWYSPVANIGAFSFWFIATYWD